MAKIIITLEDCREDSGMPSVAVDMTGVPTTSLWIVAWAWLEPSSVDMVWPTTALLTCLSHHSARPLKKSPAPVTFAA